MNTKEIGILSEAKVKADLLDKGYSVAVPEGDSQPFDLIVITPDLDFVKVQVKHGKLENGSICLSLRAIRPNRTKNTIKKYTKSQVDVFAVYNRETDSVHYISSDILDSCSSAVFLRTEPARQKKGIRYAKDYTSFPERRAKDSNPAPS